MKTLKPVKDKIQMDLQWNQLYHDYLSTHMLLSIERQVRQNVWKHVEGEIWHPIRINMHHELG